MDFEWDPTKAERNTSQTHSEDDDLRPEYDIAQLKGGVRGKYYRRFQEGTNLALLAADVRAAFPTDEAVNDALRSLLSSQPSAGG